MSRKKDPFIACSTCGNAFHGIHVPCPPTSQYEVTLLIDSGWYHDRTPGAEQKLAATVLAQLTAANFHVVDIATKLSEPAKPGPKAVK